MRLSLKNVTKKFNNNVVVKDFSAEIDSGELVTLLGSSGSGKSTILNMLSGIFYPTEGKIYFDDEDVTFMPSEKRGIGLVLQNYALYPHMTALGNICFPLEIKKVPKNERIEKARKMAKLVHIEDTLDRKPSELSGGQQQRVAIARALVKEPRLLLLDEPLSNLDANLRVELREEIRKIQLETGITTIFVTHDQEEAMSISDRIILMELGVLKQFDRPQILYDEPINCFVADFFGNPHINKLDSVVEDGRVLLGDKKIDSGIKVNVPNGTRVWFSFRAESAILDNTSSIKAKVIMTSIIGKEVITSFELLGNKMHGYIDSNVNLQRNQEIGIRFKNKGVFVFDYESGERYL